MQNKSFFSLLLTSLLSTGCGSTGACIVHDLDDGGWWCKEDEEEDYCNEEWAAEVSSVNNDFYFHEAQSCSDVGYSHWCNQAGMEASGSSIVYAASRYLSNASCDPLVPGSDNNGSGNDGCATFEDVTSYFGNVQFDSYCRDAGILRACDYIANADATCTTLQDFLNSTSGDSIRKCPYC